MQAAFKTKKRDISFEAVPFSLFNLSISCIALIPNGVAAFPSPIILAVIFITIAPKAFSSFAASLNINFKIGLKIFANLLVNPLFSATFITPHQKHIRPTNPIIRETVESAEDIIALDITSPFPVSNPISTPKNIIPNQI